MTRSARDHLNSLIKNAQGDSDAHKDTAESTGNEEHVGLYDYSPDDPRSREYVTGSRKSRPTEWRVHYQAALDLVEGRSRKAKDTRAKNASLQRARAEDPPSQTGPGGDERESDQVDTQEVRRVAQRGRSRTVRALSCSPSPGSTDGEDNQSTQAPGASQTEYTYKYETLDHEGLISCAQEEFGLDLRGCDTQTIIDRIRLAATEQAPQVGPSRRSASIVVLPSTPFQVGGGWSQEVVGRSQPSVPPKRRLQQAADLSEGSSKRQRTQATVDDDTATEPETDDEPVRTEAPARIVTATTVLDAQPSVASSHSLGGSLPPSRPRSLAPQGLSLPPPDDQPLAETSLSSLPRLLAPVRGPIHARLRKKLIGRALYGTTRDGSQALAPRASNPIEGQPTDLDEVPETDTDSPSNSRQPATHTSSSNPRTYRGHRSHAPPEPVATAVQPNDASNAADDASEPDSPNLTPSQLIRRERARAIAAKVHEEMAEMAPRRRPMFAAASQPPASRPQSRPPPRGSTAAVRRAGGASRRLDPISAAREDMLAFNQAVAQGDATSLVESVTRQSERTARCAPPKSRRPDDLLDDDEEMLAQAEAYAKRKWPRRSARVRKPKPLARDASGLARQILIMAKIHLFAYALVEGVYQTRATYLQWAALVHQATSQMDLPDRIYEKPDDEIFEIMVNCIATLRGKVKERLREFVARVAGFRHTAKNQKIIENNLVRFNRLYPNSFHCKTVSPRSGDYESPEIGHCIALAIFNGPNSVGVLYPDYFRDMPLTVVAFALAIWQFCIEEWANGWWQTGDLGTASMREKYESQLAGLKQLREVAPRRMHRLQNQWRDYVAEYSGASFEPENDDPQAHKSQMRPDTPEPDAISVEEMDARLLETARQNSLRSRMEELTAEEFAQPMDNDSDSEGSQVPPSRSPSPGPAEYNRHGVLTARAKGKGRAN